MPQSLTTTAFAGHRLAVDDRPDQERLDYVFNILGPEDQSLCESVQRGLKSRSYNLTNNIPNIPPNLLNTSPPN